VVHDLANGRLGLRCYLDKIESGVASGRERVGATHHSELRAIRADHAHLPGTNPVVYANAISSRDHTVILARWCADRQICTRTRSIYPTV
jgi:hypothetical protein